jgi:hypothetical protein
VSEIRTLGLPLRITPDGRLARDEGAAALLRLIQAMVATTANSWPHARWFGLYERFLAVNPDVEDQAGLADALNEALDRLGVDWARVRRVQSVRGAAFGERSFAVTLQLADEEHPVTAAVST